MNDYWQYLQKKYGFNKKLLTIARQVEKVAQKEYAVTGETVKFNQLRVLEAFQSAGITEAHLQDGTGYGYDDRGREGLEQVYAHYFDCEAALVRAQIVSGTHAITLALTALLSPGDELLSVTGTPYDTMARIIGITGQTANSLIRQGISYREIRLTPSGEPDYSSIEEGVRETTRLVLIQRSRGYSWRRSLTIAEIGRMISMIKAVNPKIICFVDNCYGEFVEEREPTMVGADLIAGSLIKNPGGGLAPSGGYLAGRKELVERCADKLVAPGLGLELGTNMGLGHLFYQGFFIAPQITGEALRGAIFAAHLFTALDYQTSPVPGEPRSDIVQAIKMKSKEEVLAFCRGIQEAAPVDARAIPEPGEMPGYQSKIIMAAGTFNQGASIELSADAPLRPPYCVYAQGGLSYAHALTGYLMAARRVTSGGVG